MTFNVDLATVVKSFIVTHGSCKFLFPTVGIRRQQQTLLPQV